MITKKKVTRKARTQNVCADMPDIYEEVATNRIGTWTMALILVKNPPL
jgi:hypothetical protein